MGKSRRALQSGIQIKIKLHDKYGLAYSDAEVGIMDRERGLLEQAEAGLTRAFKSFLSFGAEGDARRVAQEIVQMAETFRARGEDHRAEAIETIASYRYSPLSARSVLTPPCCKISPRGPTWQNRLMKK